MDGDKPDPSLPSRAHSLVWEGDSSSDREAHELWTLKEGALTQPGVGWKLGRLPGGGDA